MTSDSGFHSVLTADGLRPAGTRARLISINDVTARFSLFFFLSFFLPSFLSFLICFFVYLLGCFCFLARGRNRGGEKGGHQGAAASAAAVASAVAAVAAVSMQRPMLFHGFRVAAGDRNATDWKTIGIASSWQPSSNPAQGIRPKESGSRNPEQFNFQWRTEPGRLWRRVSAS